MSKFYNVEVKFGTKWTLVDVYRQHKDALWRVKESAKAKYPMRIVRVVRTVVFDGSKS
jgi:hypothetical protein